MTEHRTMAENVYTYTCTEEIPRNARYIKVEPGVTAIPPKAFRMYWNLQEVSLPEGLLEIGDKAFSHCSWLELINFPSTLKRIGKEAFFPCRLNQMDLPEGLESIGERAFGYCSLSCTRIPPCVTKIEDSIFMEGQYIDAGFMVSLELSEDVREFHFCNLENRWRNVALPPDVTILGDTGRNGSNHNYLRKELKTWPNRFDGLPIHKLCYYHSYADDTYKQVENIILGGGKKLRSGKKIRAHRVNPSGCKQDPMGFTPLHILLCSAWHCQELHELIIQHYPETLITKDKWGATPLLYAFWTRAPFIEFLLECQYELFPDVPMDWGVIIKELMHRAPAQDALLSALCTYRDLSPEKQNIEWESFLHKEAEAVGCYEFGNLKMVVAFVAYGRLASVNSKRWENQIMSIVGCPENCQKEVKTIFSLLDTYEQIKEGMSMLELALWKAKMNSEVNDDSIPSMEFRNKCRFNCYADIVIPNVLPFLSPKL